MNNRIVFPQDFLWGIATCAYQNEGGNWNSDWWDMEYNDPKQVRDHCGDACDFYNRFEEDIDLAKSLGFNAFRFSFAWERIEPEDGCFSMAALRHYERIIDKCRENGMEPIVTLFHFSLPRWIGKHGGAYWCEFANRFVRYAEFIVRRLGSKIRILGSINEPELYTEFGCRLGIFPVGSWAKKRGIDLDAAADIVRENLCEAHHRARRLVKELCPHIQYGWNVAVPVLSHREGCEALFEKFVYNWETFFFEASKGDDYLGIQTYTRWCIGAPGMDCERVDEKMPSLVTCYPRGTRLTEWGTEFYPQALGKSIAHAHEATGLPILVSENGIATSNDEERIEYLETAIGGMAECVERGIPMLGYCHWTLVDNWEWENGYSCHFGLYECDRDTFERRARPSAYWLGEVVSRGSI